MNEVMKALLERRSIRKFKAEMPKKEDIEQIIEAGLYAPNGMGYQNTIMVAVTNKELREKLRKDNCEIGGYGDTDPFYGAPLIIIVLAKKDWYNARYDGALVMGNLMLAAHSLGLGSIWINRAYQEFERDDYKKLLKDIGIEGEWEGVGHCAIGYIDGEVPEPAKRKENRVYWVE
jgi:nitroreductase